MRDFFSAQKTQQLFLFGQNTVVFHFKQSSLFSLCLHLLSNQVNTKQVLYVQFFIQALAIISMNFTNMIDNMSTYFDVFMGFQFHIENKIWFKYSFVNQNNCKEGNAIFQKDVASVIHEDSGFKLVFYSSSKRMLCKKHENRSSYFVDFMGFFLTKLVRSE